MIHNVHERTYPIEPARLGELLDKIAGRNSPLWPVDHWPPMILDRAATSLGHPPKTPNRWSPYVRFFHGRGRRGSSVNRALR